MLIDSFGRVINYLRISITDRCNYRCTYCMPSEGVLLKPHSEILRYEDIVKIARAAAEMGIQRIRITGGEPLVKRDIEFLMSEIAAISGIHDLSMTTNGSLLTSKKAVQLKKAGLMRVNISLDTLDTEKFSNITRGGDINDVIGGIDAAVNAGLMPVKINMVIFPDTTENEIVSMRLFCEQKGLIFQRIKQFSLYNRKDDVGVIVAERPPLCRNCNKIRLTADGYFKSCLFSDTEIKVDLNDIEKSIIQAVSGKPENGEACKKRTMCQIGG